MSAQAHRGLIVSTLGLGKSIDAFDITASDALKLCDLSSVAFPALDVHSFGFIDATDATSGKARTKLVGFVVGEGRNGLEALAGRATGPWAVALMIPESYWDTVDLLEWELHIGEPVIGVS